MTHAQLRFTMMSSATALVGMVLLIANGAAAAPKDALAKKDQHFIAEAIQGDLSEVKMGKLAQEKGQSDRVKQFGKTLEQDHAEHLQKAEQLAQQNGLQAPDEPNTKQTAMYQRMSGLSGKAFDAAFARGMVRDHQKDIHNYQTEANSRSDLADFAKQTIPVLKKHLDIAQSLPGAR